VALLANCRPTQGDHPHGSSDRVRVDEHPSDPNQWRPLQHQHLASRHGQGREGGAKRAVATVEVTDARRIAAARAGGVGFTPVTPAAR